MTTEKETREEKQSEAETLIAVVMDRSGSMQDLRKDTIGGYNAFLSDQKGIDVPASLTLVQFSTDYQIVHDAEALVNVPDLNDDTYKPNGGTALLDAIGRTVISIERKIKERSEKPEKVIFVIITDGEENSSREFDRDNIFKMISAKQEEENWDFVFIGANQDAIQEAGNIGIRAANSLNYAASDIGTKAMYKAMSRNMTSYRKCASVKSLDFFAAEDREEQKDLMDK